MTPLNTFFLPRARVRAWLAGLWLGCAVLAAGAATPRPVYLEELTSPELRQAIAGGATTALVPIGGTEQNGPHMTLGKHNVRVRVLAGRIAEQLGNAVVAPVLAYVPEGAITPPVAHMRFSGTLSIPEATFESLLESTARSLRQHGFRDVVFLGDHGGYQKSAQRAAERLNREWAKDDRCRALALTAYYEAAQQPFAQALHAKGLTDAEIGTHAGSADTALMLATDASAVHQDLLGQAARGGAAEGVYGDPRKATTELGQIGVRLVVERSVQAIQDAVRRHVKP